MNSANFAQDVSMQYFYVIAYLILHMNVETGVKSGQERSLYKKMKSRKRVTHLPWCYHKDNE